MEYFKLWNGTEIPAVGYGSYLATEGGKDVIKAALDAGYRYIDTARFYRNEDEIGEALEEYGIERKDIFLVSKVWPGDLGRDLTLKSFEASLKSLRTDYLDMYLIHWPKARQNDPEQEKLCIETWKLMEELYKEGKIRNIGLSNFLPHHLRPILKVAEVKPMLDQLELHVGYMQEYTLAFLRENDILPQSWSPLGRGRVLNDERVSRIAERCGKTNAKVLLRFLYQRGIPSIPKASSTERMKENQDIFDFSLTEDEISILSTIPQEGWSGEHPDLV